MPDKKPLESKKFILAVGSIALFTVVWAASYVGCLLRAESAQYIVQLATMMSGMLTIVAGAGITGQSFVDVKSVTAVGTQMENRNENFNARIEHVYHEGEKGSPERRPWTPHADEE